MEMIMTAPGNKEMLELEGAYIIYQTTNIITKEYYIGCHYTLKPYGFDGYIGSGTRIKESVKEYGEVYFRRETLFVYEDHKEAAEKEYELVDAETLLKDPLMLNMVPGGHGIHTLETRKRISECHTGMKHSPGARKNMSKAAKNMSPEARRHISKGKRKITDPQIKEIVKLRENGMTQTKIAKIYGVNKSTISRYLKKREAKQ